jgi:hypothetical protein
MSRLHINIGTTANDRTGDPLRTAFEKVNANFIELYATAGADVQIPAQATHGGKFLTTNGTTLSWGTVTPTNIGNFTFTNSAASVPVNSTLTLTASNNTTLESKLTLSPTTKSSLYAANNLELGIGYGTGVEKYWLFGADGSIRFPDASVQTTAYTGATSSTGNIAFDNDSIRNSVVNNPVVLKTSRDVVGGEETATNSNPTPSNVFFGYLVFTPSINNVQVGWTVSGDGLVGTKTVTNVAQGGFENGYWTITVDGGDGSTFAYNGTYTFTQSSSVVINQWSFSNSGVLTLPLNGDVVDSTGTSVLGTPTVLDGGDASSTF